MTTIINPSSLKPSSDVSYRYCWVKKDVLKMLPYEIFYRKFLFITGFGCKIFGLRASHAPIKSNFLDYQIIFSFRTHKSRTLNLNPLFVNPLVETEYEMSIPKVNLKCFNFQLLKIIVTKTCSIHSRKENLFFDRSLLIRVWLSSARRLTDLLHDKHKKNNLYATNFTILRSCYFLQIRLGDSQRIAISIFFVC